MATIKVFDAKGVKELQCFDTLDMVDYLPILEEETPAEDEAEASDDSVDF